MKKVNLDELDSRIVRLKANYGEKVASRFYDFPISYYSDREAKQILIKEFKLSEPEAMLVIPEVNRCISLNIAKKNPDYKQAKAIIIGTGPRNIRVEES